MAPEQILNFREAQPAADQYGTAATLYYLLTGKTIFELPKDFNKAFKMVLESRPVPISKRRPDFPTELARIIHHALAREPELRFPDAASFGKALRPFLHPLAAKEGEGNLDAKLR
jgi:serine/threonine protein kinase